MMTEDLRFSVSGKVTGGSSHFCTVENNNGDYHAQQNSAVTRNFGMVFESVPALNASIDVP